MKTLNDYSKQYKHIHFIYIEEAEDLVKNFSRKNRKKNNEVEYQMNDAKTELYKITRGNGDWCGDMMVNIVTKEEYEKALLNDKNKD